MPPPPNPAASPAAYSPGTGSAGGRQHPRRQVGLQPAERLAGEHVQPHRDQRPGRRVEQRVRAGHPHQPVAQVRARARRDGVGLEVLAERAGDISRRGPGSPRSIGGGVERRARPPVSSFIAATRPAQVRRRSRSPRPVSMKACTGPGTAAAEPAGEHGPPVPAGDVRVLLGAGQRELLGDDLLGAETHRPCLGSRRSRPRHPGQLPPGACR